MVVAPIPDQLLRQESQERLRRPKRGRCYIRLMKTMISGRETEGKGVLRENFIMGHVFLCIVDFLMLRTVFIALTLPSSRVLFSGYRGC